jgi:hypothetical protein
MSTERDLWSHYEPVHAIVYFEPSIHGCLADAGLHGFWNGYFAGRAAALGAVRAEPVTALFFGFAPAMVTKAVPKVWGRVTPEQALASRFAAIEKMLTPLLEAGSLDDVRRVTDSLAWSRPMVAPWPQRGKASRFPATSLAGSGGRRQCFASTAAMDMSSLPLTQV